MKSGDDGKDAVGKVRNGFRKTFGQDQLAEIPAPTGGPKPR